MYSARITRLNPTAFIFLIDRSGSMEEKMYFYDYLIPKAEAVALVTNMMIREIINRCRREEGIADYFDIAAIGYSAGEARMLLGEREAFVKPSALDVTNCRKRTINRQRLLPDGTTTMVSEDIRFWVEPKAEGNTPMRAAFEKALSMAEKWCRRTANANSYPPTIFNITDGEASDGDHTSMTELAERIKSLGTRDGNVLLINMNLSCDSGSETIVFPSSRLQLPASRYTDMLYDMSSVMPPEYNEAILNMKGEEDRPPFRGMSYNTTAADLFAMMNIGSRSMEKIL